MAEKWLYWLEELRREQNGLVGKERAHPGDMAKIGLPVLQGFPLSVHACTHFIEQTAATPEIAEMIAASGITAGDIAGVERLSLAIRGVVESKTIPAKMESITGIATNVCVESTERDRLCRITTSSYLRPDRRDERRGQEADAGKYRHVLWGNGGFGRSA